MSVEIRRGEQRGLTRTEWLRSRHSFSYGSYYDPDNLGFGVLQACNEDVLAAGTGFDTHLHRNVEIVTWVITGELRHSHDDGPGWATQTVGAGCAQHLGAGSGVSHGEHATAAGPAHYLQMWLRPSVTDVAPVYASHDFNRALAGGGWTAVASGSPQSTAPLRPRQLDAQLQVVRLDAGAQIPVVRGELVHLQVARGRVSVDDVGELGVGDALRLRGDSDREVLAHEAAELLAWVMYS